jgi:hypothetical protein
MWIKRRASAIADGDFPRLHRPGPRDWRIVDDVPRRFTRRVTFHHHR